MMISSQPNGYPTQVGLTVPVGRIPRVLMPSCPRSLHVTQVGLTGPGRPTAWGLASSRAAMMCLTSCRLSQTPGPAGTLVPTGANAVRERLGDGG